MKKVSVLTTIILTASASYVIAIPNNTLSSRTMRPQTVNSSVNTDDPKLPTTSSSQLLPQTAATSPQPNLPNQAPNKMDRNTNANPDNANPKTTSFLITRDHPTVTITLPSNATTGYKWSITNYDKTLLTLNDHQYITPDSNLIGAGGKEVWTFNATPLGLSIPRTTQITLLYARPWETKNNNTPKNSTTKIITITIQP